MKLANKLMAIAILISLAACGGGGSSSSISFTFTQGDPDPGATDIPANSTITAEFSSPVDSNTVTDQTFTVESDSATGRIPVSGTRTVDSANTSIAKFTPASPLNAGEVYHVKVTTGVAGTNSTSLAAETSWQFTVALVAPPAP